MAFQDSKGTSLTIDAAKQEVFDLLILKHWALRYATNAACTILRVDQVNNRWREN